MENREERTKNLEIEIGKKEVFVLNFIMHFMDSLLRIFHTT